MASPMMPNRGTSSALEMSHATGMAIPTSPVKIGRSCDVGRAVKLKDNCERTEVNAIAKAMKTP